MSIIKYTGIVLSLGIVFWISWGIYSFFFDVTMPGLLITGMDNNHYYTGDINCGIMALKSGEVTIYLDDKPLIERFKMGTFSRKHAFSIPMHTLANGKHTIAFTFVDSTYNRNKCIEERTFFIDNLPLQAAFIQLDGDAKVFQGRTLHVQFQTNKPIKQAKIRALSQTYDFFPESKNSLVYETFIPISCEENPSEYLFSIDIEDHVGNTLRLDNKFHIVMYPFKKQILTLQEEMLKQEEQLGKDAKNLEEILEQLTFNSPREKLWKGAFCPPIDIVRVSCEFGTVRTTQHKGRYAHKAVDVINHPKSVVWAPQDGVVVLKDRFENSGNAVVIDHGFGILSLFYHLDSFAKINVGDKVTKGNPIGTIGKTGHATGYHLHWEMRLGNIPIDPLQWTKNSFC